ncbi:WD repeat-containing protein 90 [Ceratobasidium sp. 423]|nr:WD repeat-containing protein 90 [Ceratobasidium sp. 423]
MKRRLQESDTTSSGSSNSTPTPGKTDKAVTSREVPIEEPKPQVPQAPIRILVVGPSGSGKTYAIENSYRDPKEPKGSLLYETTKHIGTIRLKLGERPLELIDTPGFDNINMTDVEAFAEIADYLRDPQRIQTGITGIIYVHRAGNAIYSRSLLRNIRVLANLFLGKPGLARLTILVTQYDAQGVEYGRLSDQMQGRGSVFSQVVPFGAKIAHRPDRAGFLQTLQSYAPQVPIVLPVQLDDAYKSHSTFVTRVEEELGYYEYKAAQSLLDDQERQLRELYEQKLASQREAETQLRRELQQSQLEYSSLRSQLQLQENIEQSEVVQTLHDLNRMIEDIGRSISAYLTDEYVVGIFGKNLEDVTTLDAFDFPALKLLVGHAKGASSLVSSSRGRGMQIEAFFDYTIRHMLCRHLAQHIFQPFHPGISPSLDQVLCTTYQSIQKQVPQTSAGKWRSETFKNIHDPERHHITIEQHIDDHLDKLVTPQILPLIKSVFGQNTGLKEEHYHHLRSLIQTAWDWNSRLNENVILLGEFIQVAYLPHSTFDPTRMTEFEANPRHPQPSRVLATLALGLISQRAVGGGNPVEEAVVCKAVVLTKNVFT